MRAVFLFFTFLLGFALTSTGQGSGLQLTLLGQRQVAMGNTGTALAKGPGVTWFNPAGMSFLDRRGYLQIGGSIYRPLTSFLEAPPAFDFEAMDTVSISPAYLYGVFRPSGQPRLALGVSLNSPYAAATLWPDDWNGRLLAQEFRLTSLFFQPALSYRLNKSSSLGLGLTYGITSILSRKAIDISGKDNTRSTVSFSGQGLALGLNLGFYHIYSDKLSMGITLRSPIQVNINDGLASFNVPNSLEAQYPDQGFSTEISLPFKANIGLAYRPESRLEFALDLKYSHWSSLDSLDFVLEEEVGGLLNFPRRAWINTFSFHGGMEYLVNEHLYLRAGLSYNNSPVPDNFMIPDLPDADRIAIHGGLGVSMLRNLVINFSLGYNYTGERTNSLRTASFGGIYESIAYHFGIDLGYRF